MCRHGRMRIGAAIAVCILLMARPGPIFGQDAPLNQAGGGTVTIGVVTDGPSPGDTLIGLIEQELRLLVAGRGVEVTFKDDPAFDAGWQAARMAPALQAALDDPEVDFVVTSGLLVTQAATQASLTKPVVSGFLQRLEFFKIADLDGDRSLKENLRFVLLANRGESDVGMVQEMEAPARIYIAASAEDSEQFDNLASELASLESATGIDLEILPLSTNVAQSLATVDSTVEAILLGPTPRYSTVQRREFLDSLTERRISTFSFVGHGDLELGIMAARTPPTATFVSRRVALNLSELIRGASTGDLPVLVTADPELVIDGRTAAAVGYRPSLITLGYATIRNADALELAATPLALAEAMHLAETGNPNLAISAQQVEISRRERQLQLSPMLPQVGAGIDVTWQDAAGLQGLIPDRLLKAGVDATQMIYDDATISRYRASGRLYEGQQLDNEAVRLDVLQQAGVAFLRFQFARALYEIELQNLRLTEENLELAKFRVDVGYSGRDEVFRWEAETAKRRADLYDRMAVVEAEQVALNQVLGVDQATRWDPQEIPVDAAVFPFLDGRLPSMVTDIRALEAFRRFAVSFAIENGPELMSAGMRREAQEIQVGQRKRTWFLPSLFAGFQWNYHLDRDPTLDGVSRSLPKLQLGASYPVFQGAARSFEVSRSTAELDQLLERERLTRDLIERQTRTSFSRLEASFPSLRFSQIAAESARRNFELVQDKYAQGLVNVTDLLEAQTESFVADQSAAGSVSVFLIDLVNFQRAIAWFEDDQTPEEQDALLRRIQDAIEQ